MQSGAYFYCLGMTIAVIDAIVALDVTSGYIFEVIDVIVNSCVHMRICRPLMLPSHRVRICHDITLTPGRDFRGPF